ncbi:MAG: hypothetical protein HY986_14980 [Candidatus Melainabacteria bacterium]|nr:hypothetical protein [Candidatus Melainabacteria bacterium]
MPRKGLFTQGFCVVTDKNIDIEVVKAALVKYEPRYVEATPESNWQMGGEMLELDGPLPGLIATVDVVNRQWPEDWRIFVSSTATATPPQRCGSHGT